jgi:hypothetical protein
MLARFEDRVCDGTGLKVAESVVEEPYSFFSEDCEKIFAASLDVANELVKKLQVEVMNSMLTEDFSLTNHFCDRFQLEVIQFVGMGDGEPVSTVDFERAPVDLSMVNRMVSESRRELISATEKTLDRIWTQHKALVIEHFFEQFERGICNIS